MKIKYIIISLFLIVLCGCHTVKNEEIPDIVNNLSRPINKINTYHTGYSYYIPKGLSVKEYSPYNEVLESNEYEYYLYIDLISYYNKVKNEYEANKTSYYSERLKNDDKYGYVEINLQENNQYLIEIMFNYAKIEVMVDEDDIKDALSYSVAILRSIEYNDEIIANLLGDDVLSFQEEVYDIFNTTGSESSNYLKAIEEDQYVEPDIKDTDLIN